MTTGAIASVEPLAADAGAGMLRLGGNAIDAAVATAFAQGVVDPIYCGIAGAFQGIFHSVASGETKVVVAGGYAPAVAREDMWELESQWGATWIVKGRKNEFGYEASTVPGFIRGAYVAFERFGSGNVTWQQIIEPAIQLADEGFEVYPYLYRLWMPPNERMPSYLESLDGPALLGQTEESRSIYLKDDGSVYGIGERLFQRDYAKALRRIAEHGPDEFYVGEIGRRIAEDFGRNGGLLTAADLRDFEPEVVDPIETTFRDFTVLTEPTPSVGPVLLEILNIIEGWSLRDLGWNTAPYLDCLAQAMHVAFRDRMSLLGDPRFEDVPEQMLISKEYARDLRQKIDANRTPGSERSVLGTSASYSETTHVSAIDAHGNAASITHSLGNSSGVVTPGLGFQHNSNMVMFNPVPGQRNSIAPLKKPITGGGPTLFMRGSHPWLAIGSPGGAWKVTGIVQALLNMLDFSMPLADAIAAERVHVENDERTIRVQPHFPAEPLLGLGRMGYRIQYELYTARLAAVERRLSDGGLDGASDPRGGGGLAIVDAPDAPSS